LIGASIRSVRSRVAWTGPLAKVSSQKPAAHLVAASACESFCAAACQAGLAAACQRQSYDLWKQLFFELLTDIVSCQAICTRRRFSPDCLLARMRQNWSFGSGAHIALRNKEKLAPAQRAKARLLTPR
jgi:hypothetical protein